MPVPTDTPPATAKGEATRAFLLRTAAAVFAEHGYTGTTLNDLIAASGLTKGAFYFHFRSKSALALAVLRDQQRRWSARIGETALAGSEPADQLRALIPAMLDVYAADPGAWAMTRLTRELSAEPAVGEDVCRPAAEWVDLVADIVRRGQAAGTIRDTLPPDHVAAVLVGAFDGLKSLTDLLDPGHGSSAVFAERARTLLALVELALLDPPPTR